MLGLSWSELFIIIVIALVVIKPQDYPAIIRSVRNFITKCKELQREITGAFQEIVDQAEIQDLQKEVRDINKHIIGLDGNLHETYDVNELKALLEKQQKNPPPSEPNTP